MSVTRRHSKFIRQVVPDRRTADLNAPLPITVLTRGVASRWASAERKTRRGTGYVISDYIYFVSEVVRILYVSMIHGIKCRSSGGLSVSVSVRLNVGVSSAILVARTPALPLRIWNSNSIVEFSSVASISPGLYWTCMCLLRCRTVVMKVCRPRPSWSIASVFIACLLQPSGNVELITGCAGNCIYYGRCVRAA